MLKSQSDVWKVLTIDLEDEEVLAQSLPEKYAKYYRPDENRPKVMKYFDAIVAEYGESLLQQIIDFQIDGGKIAGTYCAHIPDDLIYASGAFPVGLCSASATFAQLGEQYMPVNTCPLVKASLGARLTKSCPYAATADLLIGETSCDAKTKAWPIMQEEADMFVLYLPHRKEAEDFEKFRQELYKMAAKLAQVTGHEVTYKSLKEAIVTLNNHRRAINRLWDYRKGTHVPISGKDCLIIQQASRYISSKQFVELMDRVFEELDQRIEEGISLTDESTPRIMLTGSPIGMQSWHINSLIERGGGMVVVEETCGSTRLYERYVDESGETLDELITALAEKYFNGIHCACFTPNKGRLEDISRLAQEYQVDGVIDIHLKFCQIFDMEHYFVENHLDKENVPCIGLEVDYGDDESGQMLTRIEAFLEMIRA